MVMTLYRGKRYHLKEWAQENQRFFQNTSHSSFLDQFPISRPLDCEELFNLRHAQARNAVEHIFGVFKRRFKLLASAPEYSLKMQARFIPALAAVHNFIQIHEPSDRLWDSSSSATGSQVFSENGAANIEDEEEEEDEEELARQ